jgi:Lysozyme-like
MPMAKAVVYDDRDALYGPLDDHYLRIGDSQFYIPPTSISVHRQMKNKRVSVIRGRNSLPKESGYYDRIVTITLFFPDMDAINFELRPLLAQAKKCPFLPIENVYLNGVHGIEAITIQGITVQTTPGFPHTLQAVIQAYVFEPATYIYGTSDRSFDEMFNWPLFRWYYSRNLEPSTGKRKYTFFEPLVQELHDGYMFRIVAEDDLKAIRDWRRYKDKLIKEWLKDKQNKVGPDFEDWLKFKIKNAGGLIEFGNEAAETIFNEKYNELYKRAMFEYDLHYETWDVGDLFLQEITVSFENAIVSQQLQMHASPTHQYLGSQDTVIVARFRTDDQEALASLENLVKRATYYAREYHKEVANGFLQFDHQLVRLYGIKNVVIEDMVVDTVKGQPGVYDVTLTMMGYNRAERKMHETKALTLGLDWKIPLWEIDPIQQEIYESLTELMRGINIDMTAEQQAVYNAKVLEVFKHCELYPDLELPTYEEVKAAGFDIPNLNSGVYADPDFFLIYDTPRDFSEVLNQVMKENHEIRLKDGMDGEAILYAASGVDFGYDLNDKAKKNIEEAQRLQNSNERIDRLPTGNYPINKDNLKPSEMEALIRKVALDHGLNDVYPIAFVKHFDKEFHHFYLKGANPKFGNIRVNKTGVALMQDKNFQYTLRDGDVYIGVMRVSRPYGTPTLLKQSILYNVEIGIKYMKHYWNEVEETIMSGKDFDSKPLFQLFNLKKSEVNKAHFAAMLFLYLGYRKELYDLVGKNKQPQAAIVKRIRSILNELSRTNDWSENQIRRKYDELPLKDIKNTKTPSDPQNKALKEIDALKESDYAKNQNIQKGMLHDMLKYDRRGRLVRAFPTFFLTFVDEGKFIGSVKMSDQYFHYRAVMDISFNNSRKQAASTLVAELSNVFGSLSDAEKAMDLTYTSTWDLVQNILMPGALARETERSRHRDSNYYKTIMLRTGVRVHFRMGYGANAVNLPTIINGTITALQNNNETITMVVQSDGIELTNKLNAHLDIDPSDETAGFLSTTKEVTEIVDELLTDSKGFWKNLSALMSNEEYDRHSLGIMHFGDTGGPQGWQDVKDIINFITLNGVGREIAEINMNVYQTTGLLNTEHDEWWNRFKDALGLGESDEVGININLYDKTVWDVLNIAAAIGTDMITAVHPFGLRSTIFLGKPYFPLHYDYKVDLKKEKVTGTYVKPFKQLHFYDSYMSIIDNSIKTTEENMYTVAVGTYMNEGKIETTPPIYVDTNIWPEKQKTVNIDTMINAKGVWLFDKLPFVGSLLNKPFQWYFDEGIAIRIAASGLRDFVKDMYDGYLTVMGDPSVKPYDTMIIQDTYNAITGPADIKEVIHIMNADVGFITMIKPDTIVFNRDKRIFELLMMSMSWVTAAAITMGLRAWLASRGYTGTLPIINAIWASTSKQFRKMKNRFDDSLFMKKAKELYRKKTGKSKPNSDKVINVDFVNKKKIEEKALLEGGTPKEDIDRWKKNGMFDKAIQFFDDVNQEQIEELLKKGEQRLLPTRRIDRARLDKLRKKSSKVMLRGSKRIAKTLKSSKGLLNFAKGVVTGAIVLSGPIGWLFAAIEMALVHMLVASIGEYLNRFLMTRQACIIVPLKKDGRPWTAGINGHKGSVVGDPKDLWQSLATSWFGSTLLALLGVDAQGYATPDYPENMNDVTPFASSVAKKPRDHVISIESVIKGLVQSRITTIQTNGLPDLYKKDVKAAYEELRGRKAKLDARSEAKIAPNYDDLKENLQKADNFLKKFAEWLLGLGKADAEEGTCSNDIGVNGRAVNVSPQVRAYEPTIRKYAEKYGVAGYVPIIMAFMMQESGGRGSDPMQASESYCGRIGCIKDPELSINQGVKYFAQMLKKANGDVKLALQAYNYGTGFIDYVMKRGGRYTKQLAWEFAEYMVRKLGRRISRIPPGYGDSKYVDRVLRYYEGDLTPCVMGGSDDYPTVTGSTGKQKYHLSLDQARKVLIDAKAQKDREFTIQLAGGSSTSLMRKGTYQLVNQLAKLYKQRTGQTLKVTSAYRINDPNWHGTGYAVDIDTPNTMRTLAGGKLGFPPGRDKENATLLTDLACQVGFNGIVFGDYYILESMKRKYKGLVTQYRPHDHHNHLHLSYPTGKKK